MADIIVKARDEVIDGYKRSYKLRLPGADTRDGMQPDISARCVADMLMPVYSNCVQLGRGLLLSGRVGDELDAVGALEGVPRGEAKGASGYVVCRTSSTGAYALEGDELTDPNTGIAYACSATALYTDQSDVPVACRETGPTTNLDAGTVLRWSAPRYGMLPTATVKELVDGSGLSGGGDAETDDSYVRSIIAAREQRSNSGNDIEYQRQAKMTPGVGVEEAFTFPAILGPGTIGLAFTLKPATIGGSRCPSAAQVALVEAWLRGQFPADDGLVMCLLIDENFTVAARVKWDTVTDTWADVVQWPPYYAVGGTPGPVVVSSAASSTVFTLSATSYTWIAQPVAGQTIGFYDAGHARFSRKKILSFTGTGPWVITCDTALAASDTSFTPTASQRAMPWSESLQLLAAPCLAYVQRMGPGEQVAADPGDGRRQMRSPSPKSTSWPLAPGNRIETELLVSGIADVEVLAMSPTTTTVGTQGVSSNILHLTDFSVFAW